MSRNKPGTLYRVRQALKFYRHGFRAFRPVEPRDFEQKKAPFIWPTWRQGEPTWQIIDYLNYAEEGFNLNAIIYSAIMYKARSIMAAPLRAYTGTYQAPELLDVDHPLSKLCARPNVYQSWAEFQALNEVYLNLSGNCYVLVDRKRGEEIPQALYPLRPDRVYIVPGRQSGNIAKMLGYLYVPEGMTQRSGIPFLPQDIMHVKLPNPLDPLEGMGYGLSPIAPMAQSADVDNQVTKYLKLFFERGAMPPGMLKFDVPMTPEDVAEARERWQEIYGGVDNWADVAVLDQGGDYQRLGLSFDEMGFGVIDERNEARILAPFGVPPILVGTRFGLARSTYSNYAQARRAFWEDTMVPELTMFEDEYRYYLRTEDGAFVKFDYGEVPALQHDIPALTAAWSTLVAQGVPGSVAAETVGLDLPKYPGSNTSYRPMMMIPSGTIREDGEVEETTPALPEPEPAPTSEGEQGAAEAVEEADEAEDEGKGQKADVPPGEIPETPEGIPGILEEPPAEEQLPGSPFSQEQKAAFWKAHDNFALTWEERFSDAAYEALDHDRREILAIVNGAKAKALHDKATIGWMTTFLTIKQYLEMGAADNWRDVFAPVMHTMIAERAEQLDAEFGVAFDVHNWLAEDWFSNYTITFAQPINADTEKAIRMMCQQATNEGWSVYTMTNHLETMFKQWMSGGLSPEEFAWYEERMPMYRRENIARTEEMGALNQGSQELYTAWGAKGHEWLATMDNRVRDDHAAANGQVRRINEPFNVGGIMMMHPGAKTQPDGGDVPPEQVCQCRCSVLPVLPQYEGVPYYQE